MAKLDDEFMTANCEAPKSVVAKERMPRRSIRVSHDEADVDEPRGMASINRINRVSMSPGSNRVSVKLVTQ